MSPALRVELFGHDPLNHKEPYFHKWTLIITLALTGLIIGGTLFFIEFVISPEIKPIIHTSQFELPLTDGLESHSELYTFTNKSWLAADWATFSTSADSLIRALESQTDLRAIQEIQLYKLQSHLLLENWNEGETLAQGLLVRYPYDSTFQSDVYYFLGHIISKKRGLENAYTTFAESYELGGRYSDESKRIMERIEQISRPLWQ